MTVNDPKTFCVAIMYALTLNFSHPPCIPDHLSSNSGSGLGGLLLALFLQKSCPQIDIAIYESAHELSEIGAGIGVWPRIWEILRNLGLEEDLIEVRGTQDKIGESSRRITPEILTDSSSLKVHPTHILKGDEQEMFLIRDITPLCTYFFSNCREAVTLTRTTCDRTFSGDVPPL